jgi:hypothetical protein
VPAWTVDNVHSGIRQTIASLANIVYLGDHKINVVQAVAFFPHYGKAVM